MRIDALTQMQQVYGITNTNSAKRTTTGKSFSDSLQISGLGRDMQIAKTAIAGSSDIREDVVAPIRESIRNGSYEVDSESFADKLLKKIDEMG